MKMVPNDFPCQKTLGLTPKPSLEHVQNQSFNFTPWSCPWPPTAPPPYSWPTWKSVASETGPKWFLILKNLEFDTKTKSLANSEAKLWNSPFISQGAFYSKIGKSELAMDRSKYPISDEPRGSMGQLYYRINQKKCYTNEKIIFEK